MTTIDNIVGGNLGQTLRTADKKAEGSEGIERFAPPKGSGETNSAVSQFIQRQDVKEAKGDEKAEKKDPLQKASETLESFIPDAEFIPNTRLRIDRDDTTGLFVYQSVDNDSGEVRRQFPAEDILKFLSYYRELEGLAVDDEA
ncbi:flagellar protein FlaG [Gimibacter soli]|uniref:Flagellar protein FlaG n=1 Tax=Gimibacter soli TaxID=3024400 RepID=A0AAF0BLE4_9PROT|nr:flagellar protein FlaG [Gimibacter soli]WCL53071.1 flagellar protein FlaG [Gimibacter soli]